MDERLMRGPILGAPDPFGDIARAEFAPSRTLGLVSLVIIFEGFR